MIFLKSVENGETRSRQLSCCMFQTRLFICKSLEILFVILFFDILEISHNSTCA